MTKPPCIYISVDMVDKSCDDELLDSSQSEKHLYLNLLGNDSELSDAIIVPTSNCKLITAHTDILIVFREPLIDEFF